ncbi:MAG: hypothetical protein ACREMN_05060 [Gemmatimonadales bacterium]
MRVALTAALPLLVALVSSCLPIQGAQRELSICTDPHDLPFSDGPRRALAQRLAQLIGDDLAATVQFTSPTPPGSRCDLVLGARGGHDRIFTTPSPLVLDVGIGVHRDESALRDELDAVLVRRRVEIERLLDAYGLPLGAGPGEVMP